MDRDGAASDVWRLVAETTGRDRSDALRELAEDLSSDGRDVEALAAVEAAGALLLDGADVVEAARCDQDASLLLARLGRIDEAVERSRAALEVFDGQLLEREAAECRGVLGRQLFAGGAADEATRLWREAAEAFDDLDDLGAATTRMDLAAVLLDLGRTDEAAGHLERARTDLRQAGEYLDVAKIDVQRAEVSRRRRDLDGALRLLEAAAAVFDAADAEAAGWVCDDRRFEVLLDAGRAAEAAPQLEAAREVRRQEGVVLGVAWCDLHLSRAYDQLGRSDEAARHRVRARAVFDAAGRDELLRRPELAVE